METIPYELSYERGQKGEKEVNPLMRNIDFEKRMASNLRRAP